VTEDRLDLRAARKGRTDRAEGARPTGASIAPAKRQSIRDEADRTPHDGACRQFAERLRGSQECLRTTVNDVVLAAIAGALRIFLAIAARMLTRHGSARAFQFRPSRIVGRARSWATHAGDRGSARRRGGPAGAPGAYLRVAAAHQGVAKGDRRAGDHRGGRLRATDDLAYASRLSFATDRFDLLVTNVPGPRARSRCWAQMEKIYRSLLVHDQALAVGSSPTMATSTTGCSVSTTRWRHRRAGTGVESLS